MANHKPLVLLTHRLPEDWVGDLYERLDVKIGKAEKRGIDESLIEFLPETEGILCLLDDPIPEDILDQAPKLKVISNMAVGVDNIDVPACIKRGIPVGHTPGVLTEGTADLTLALLLAIARRIPQASLDAREGRWSNWDPTGWLGIDFTGTTIGIVGLGKIGTAVAERLKAFGANLVFSNRSRQPEKEKALQARQVELDELLRISDVICLHVPLTPQTENLFDAETFRKMKPSSILINAARGKVVDTDALVNALKDEKIRAAGLDVTEPEPLPPDHILYQLDNCLITPHIGSATENTRKTMARIAIDNLKAGIKGAPLLHCVNPEVQ
jgi:lactate dehydrogenase-like 2-hydroxyacid dehydrogenase